jgi:osmotically-inducible protein OsmY
MPRFAHAGAHAAGALGWAACTPAGVVVGAGTTAGLAASQERGIPGAVSDNVIAAGINKKWLEHDVDLFMKLGVEVHDGQVLLTGVVPDPEARIEAVRLAWEVDGVKQVFNEIEVSDESGLLDKARDRLITARLRTDLMLDNRVNSLNYTIDTVNGVVYILGIAQNEAELARVTDHARNMEYVRRVIPHVRIKSPIPGAS